MTTPVAQPKGTGGGGSRGKVNSTASVEVRENRRQAGAGALAALGRSRALTRSSGFDTLDEEATNGGHPSRVTWTRPPSSILDCFLFLATPTHEIPPALEGPGLSRGACSLPPSPGCFCESQYWPMSSSSLFLPPFGYPSRRWAGIWPGEVLFWILPGCELYFASPPPYTMAASFPDAPLARIVNVLSAGPRPGPHQKLPRGAGITGAPSQI